MRGLLLAALTLLVAPAAMAVHYRGTTLSPDRTKLVLHTDRGGVLAPRTDKGQQGFAGPHVSPDGRMVGWLELVPLQGNDGPMPGALVIFRDDKIVRRFYCGDLAIYEWAFADGGKPVACVQSTLHSPNYYVYKLLRISDGHVLGKFSCGWQRAGTPPKLTHIPPAWVNEGNVPSWVWPIAQGCPTR